MLRIKEIAKSRGVTLTELAEILGISNVSLSYTLKKGNPTLQTLQKIAVALGVDVVDLLEPTKTQKTQLQKTPSAVSVLQTDKGQKIEVEIFIKLIE